MGGCCSKDTTKKREVLADITVKDLEEVTFTRQVKRAEIAPADGSKPAVDVTETLQKKMREEKTLPLKVEGGIHNAVGLHFEGEAKVFRAWYFPETPDLSVDDFDTVNLTGVVALATYGVEPAKAKDVTELVQTLQAEGKSSFVGGPHVLLREPLPSDPNVLRVWYKA
jgi:hypothetical protein